MSKMLIIRHISMGSEKTLNYTKNRYEWRITTIFFTENLSNVYCGGCLCLVYIAVEL